MYTHGLKGHVYRYLQCLHLNIQDINVWMWLKTLAPKGKPLSSLKLRLHDFYMLQQWQSFINHYEILPAYEDSLQDSVTRLFLINSQATLDNPLEELV